MKINSKELVLNLMGQESNLLVNKKLLLTLGMEETIFLSYLIDQYKYYDREGKLRADGSFYTTNFDIALFTTINVSKISKIKKRCMEKDLFTVSLEDHRSKSYYYLNFDKILEIIGTDKTNLELAYDNVYDSEENDISLENDNDIENLKKFTVKDLRYFCKKNKIKYSGNDDKENLIKKIIEFKNPILFSSYQKTTIDKNISTSGREIHPPRENEQFKKFEILDDKIASTSGREMHPPRENEQFEISVDAKCIHSGRVFYHKPIHNKPILNIMSCYEEKNSCEKISCDKAEEKNIEKNKRDKEIEKIFKELEINYTNNNVEISNEILKKFNGNKEFLKEYILKFHDKVLRSNRNITNKAAFFSASFKEIDDSLIQNILRKSYEKENEKKEKVEKIEKEKIMLEEIKKSDLFLDKFECLEEKIKNEILELAEKKLISENKECNVSMLQSLKNLSYKVYLKFLSKSINNIFSEKGILLQF